MTRPVIIGPLWRTWKSSSGLFRHAGGGRLLYGWCSFDADLAPVYRLRLIDQEEVR